jgi:hypothetical protein
MKHERTHKSSSWKPSNQETSISQFAPRPNTIQAQQHSQKPPTQEEIENEAFNQDKHEAFGLQLKEKYGAIAPGEQERLGVLQAKIDDFWVQRWEKRSHLGHNIANIPIHAPDKQVSAPIQPHLPRFQAKLTIGEPEDKYEQEADRVASQVVEQINTPSAAQSTPGQSVQRQQEPDEELQAKPSFSVLQRSPLPTQVHILPQDKARSALHKYAKPTTLYEGIPEDMSDDEKMNQLLANFRERTDFQYVGGRKGAFQGSGDCGTLVSEFLIIGKAILNDPSVLKGKEETDKPFFIPNGGKIIGDSRTGNVDGGKHWIFDQHVWVLYNGSVIDVLFGTREQRWIRGTINGDTYTFEGQQYKKSVFMDKTEWHVLSQ